MEVFFNYFGLEYGVIFVLGRIVLKLIVFLLYGCLCLFKRNDNLELLLVGFCFF